MAYDYMRDAKANPIRHGDTELDPIKSEQANINRGGGQLATHGGLAGPHATKTSGMDSAKDQNVRAGDELEQAFAALWQRLDTGGVLKDQPQVKRDDSANSRPTALSSMARFIDGRTDHLRGLTARVVDLIGLLDI